MASKKKLINTTILHQNGLLLNAFIASNYLRHVFPGGVLLTGIFIDDLIYFLIEVIRKTEGLRIELIGNPTIVLHMIRSIG